MQRVLRVAAAGLLTALTALAQVPQLVLDIDPAPGVGSSASVLGPSPIAGEVLLVGDDGVHGSELWRSDGTPAGTSLIADVAPGSASAGYWFVATVAGVALFVVDAGNGQQMWRTDGTATGTSVLIGPAGPASITQPVAGAPGNGVLFFNVGSSAYRTDGTPNGTFALGVGMAYVVGPLGGFTLLHGFNGDLIASDGTSTVVFGNVPGTLRRVADGQFLLTNSSFGPGGFTTTLTWIGKPGTPSTTLSGLARVYDAPGALLLTESTRLQRWDGLAPPQVLGTWPAWSARLWQLGDRWVFTAVDPALGNEIGFTDGTPAGTFVLDVLPGPQGSAPNIATTVQSGVVFWADVGGLGSEPFRSDGTAAGTFRLGDLEPGPGSSVPRGFAAVAGGARRSVLAVETQALGLEQWITDVGLTAITLVADLRPGPASSMVLPGGFFIGLAGALGGALVWSADDGVHGPEPWRLPLAGTRTPLRSYGPRRFDTGDPVLGGVWNLRCTWMSPGEIGVVAVSPPASTCVPIAPLRCVHLDLANAFVVAAVIAGPSGEWSGALPLANQPSAVGLDLVAQPLFVAPALPLGIDVGDALWLSLGP